MKLRKLNVNSEHRVSVTSMLPSEIVLKMRKYCNQHKIKISHLCRKWILDKFKKEIDEEEIEKPDI